MSEDARADEQQLTLSEATEHLLEESRMVLPGMQALFGFQLIAVFNPTFSEKLEPVHQRLHLASIALVVLAVAIIMTPAAYHRQTSPRAVSAHFIALSTRLLLVSMAPLALAICLDFYVVAWLIAGNTTAAVLAAGLFGAFSCLWLVLPRARRARDILGQHV